MIRFFSVISLVVMTLSAGCGYSARALLPARFRVVYVEPFTNRMHLTQLSTELRTFQTTVPRLQEDVTNEVINRFIFDGYLQVTAKKENADLVLVGEIIDFHRQELRQDESGNVEEYRLNLIANLVMHDATKGEVLWEEPSFIGDTTYFLSGSSSISEADAMENLITNFAQRAVERTIEDW